MTAQSDPPSGDRDPGSTPPSRSTPQSLDLLIAEARYNRQRYDIYRAKMYGLRPTSEPRLRELQRACESAESRLAAARAARRAGSTG